MLQARIDNVTGSLLTAAGRTLSGRSVESETARVLPHGRNYLPFPQ